MTDRYPVPNLEPTLEDVRDLIADCFYTQNVLGHGLNPRWVRMDTRIDIDHPEPGRVVVEMNGKRFLIDPQPLGGDADAV